MFDDSGVADPACSSSSASARGETAGLNFPACGKVQKLGGTHKAISLHCNKIGQAPDMQLVQLLFLCSLAWPLAHAFRPPCGVAWDAHQGTRLLSACLQGERRPVNPRDLPPCALHLHDDATRTNIYLVGTIHTSERSASDVRRVIELTQPHAVMLELCPSRFASMFPLRKQRRPVAAKKQASDREQQDELAPGTQTVSRTLGGVYRVLGSLGMEAGRDFSAGVDGARAVGAQIVLGDRDAFATMSLIAELWNFRQVFSDVQLCHKLPACRRAHANAPPAPIGVGVCDSCVMCQALSMSTH